MTTLNRYKHEEETTKYATNLQNGTQCIVNVGDICV